MDAIEESERRDHIREMMTVMQEEEWWQAISSVDPDSETMSREASPAHSMCVCVHVASGFTGGVAWIHISLSLSLSALNGWLYRCGSMGEPDDAPPPNLPLFR